MLTDFRDGRRDFWPWVAWHICVQALTEGRLLYDFIVSCFVCKRVSWLNSLLILCLLEDGLNCLIDVYECLDEVSSLLTDQAKSRWFSWFFLGLYFKHFFTCVTIFYFHSLHSKWLLSPIPSKICLESRCLIFWKNFIICKLSMGQKRGEDHITFNIYAIKRNWMPYQVTKCSQA